uniref:Uncharacterized protein n=1 Tax=Anguilla anguilla TaxID=7936 RepID=A0A0E9TKN4_ANGAN
MVHFAGIGLSLRHMATQYSIFGTVLRKKNAIQRKLKYLNCKELLVKLESRALTVYSTLL